MLELLKVKILQLRLALKAFNHCKSSKSRFGGKEEDYHAIHAWFDESKAHVPDIRHRMLRHHSQGIEECEKTFGIYLQNSDGKKVPVKSIAEQHILEDLGFIPTLQDWISNIYIKSWMNHGQGKRGARNKKLNLA